MYVCMHVCMYECMYVRMCVYLFMFFHLHIYALFACICKYICICIEKHTRMHSLSHTHRQTDRQTDRGTSTHLAIFDSKIAHIKTLRGESYPAAANGAIDGATPSTRNFNHASSITGSRATSHKLSREEFPGFIFAPNVSREQCPLMSSAWMLSTF